MRVEDLLSQTDLFRGMEAEALARLGVQCAPRELAPGEHLFLEGATGASFFLLLEGTVRLYKTGPDGQEISVRLVRPGEIFAEVILFENPGYPVNAVAVGASRVCVIPREVFLAMLDERAFRNRFIANLMRKQRYLAERIRYLTTFDVEERFFRFLLERYGRRAEYAIDLSKKDISSAIGTIPETLSRLVQRLKQAGVVEWEGTRLKVEASVWEAYPEES